MKRSILLSMLILVVLSLPSLLASQAAVQEVVLFDGPRGGWLATVRGDVSMEVLEERDGWRRVRMEGWISGSAPAADQAPAPGASTEPGGEVENVAVAAAGLSGVAASSTASRGVETGQPAAAAQYDRGVTVSGVLLPTHNAQAAGPGVGLVVLLVTDLAALDKEHASAGQWCHEGLKISHLEIEARRVDYKETMNSSDNFKEAAQRSDRAKKALKQAEQAHRERIDECRRSADEVFQKYTVQRAISDSAGRFEFVGVSMGEYRVIAAEIGGEAPRAWALDCPVAGTAPVVLDPRSDRSQLLPYWGLDRDDGSGEGDKSISFGA